MTTLQNHAYHLLSQLSDRQLGEAVKLIENLLSPTEVQPRPNGKALFQELMSVRERTLQWQEKHLKRSHKHRQKGHNSISVV